MSSKDGRVPDINIIIPVYRGYKETVDTIISVYETINFDKVDVKVINDRSPEPIITDWLKKNKDKYKFSLYENEENLGFVGTVNFGIGLSECKDVILLNSDVEVANDWVERLAEVAYSSSDIASVTATSNNATICSFPGFCEDNELPLGLSAHKIDASFKRNLPPASAVEIPTGVGFCMYMRREAIKEIGVFDEKLFKKGYGEENDWCQRAIAYKWRNLQAQNVFVYHKGAVSFAEKSNPTKETNLIKLLKRYPDYNLDIQNFINKDVGKVYRIASFLGLLNDVHKPKILLMAHGKGGGVYTHLKELIKENNNAVFLLVEPVKENIVRLHLYPFKGNLFLDFEIEKDYGLLIEVLRLASVSHIHVHHTMGLPTRLWGLNEDLGIGLDYTLHDYTIVNGNPSLLDKRGYFVGDSDARDELCSEAFPLPPGISPESWRLRQLKLLGKARFVICPSFDVQLRVSKVKEFSKLKNWVVTQHLDSKYFIKDNVRFKESNGSLRVLVVGALSPEKGADILEEVSGKLKQENIEFHLLGYAYRPLKDSVISHGPYSETSDLEKLNRIDPDIIWFPHTCAETYSYTLSLAFKAQLPVVASDIGAFKERLSGRKHSVLFSSYCDSSQWVHFWKECIRDPNVVRDSIAKYYHFPDYMSDFYSREYLNSIPIYRENPYAIEFSLISSLLKKTSNNDREIVVKERILSKLLAIRGNRLGRIVSKLVPLHMQRAIKRKLSKKPTHDIH